MIMNKILSKLKESNRIAITFHSSPDGDSLGSSLALMLGLKKMNKDAYIACKEALPKEYSFLPFGDVIDGSRSEILEGTDCLICLDCGDVKRLNLNFEISNRNFTVINIDHHISNELYGDLNYVDTNASAAAELVYGMLRSLGIKIDKDIATCLYVSLVTDSGSFRYSNTTSVTHVIAGDLINCGIDFSNLHRLIYENKEFRKVKLIGKVIDSMELIDDKICVMTLTKEMMESAGYTEECDSGDVISVGMQIGTIDCAVMLKESEKGIKTSLRSKNIVDVRKVAEAFGGGGHIRAAGALFKDITMQEAKEKLILKIKNELM